MENKFMDLKPEVIDELTFLCTHKVKDLDEAISDCINMQGLSTSITNPSNTVDQLRAFRNSVVKLVQDVGLTDAGQKSGLYQDVLQVSTGLIDAMIKIFGGAV